MTNPFGDNAVLLMVWAHLKKRQQNNVKNTNWKLTKSVPRGSPKIRKKGEAYKEELSDKRMGKINCKQDIIGKDNRKTEETNSYGLIDRDN